MNEGEKMFLHVMEGWFFSNNLSFKLFIALIWWFFSLIFNFLFLGVEYFNIIFIELGLFIFLKILSLPFVRRLKRMSKEVDLDEFHFNRFFCCWEINDKKLEIKTVVKLINYLIPIREFLNL